MKKICTLALLIVFHVVFMGITAAQDVLVSVEQKTSVFPSQVSNYIDNPYKYYRIRLQNLTGQTQRIYLTMEISCQYSASGESYRIATDDKRNTVRPLIELAPNQSYVIDNRERYDAQFSGRLTTNMSNGIISSMSRLPEGNYNLCVNACRWSQNVTSDNVIGNNCMSFMVCYTGSAPELITPIGGLMVTSVGEAIPEVEPARNINFRWTGVITNCLQVARFDYTIKIVKLQPGQNYNDAIRQNGTFFSKDCGNKTFYSLDTMRDLNQNFERGATYAVQVTATQRGNATIQIGNDGKSIVQCFKWGHKDAYIPGNAPDDENDESTAPPHLIPAWTRQIKQTQTTYNNRGKVLDSVLPPCIVYPEKDKNTASILTERNKSEESNFPKVDRTVVSTYLQDGTPVIDPAAKGKVDIKWLPASQSNILLVDYDVKLYEYMGNYTVTTSRPALKTKHIEGEPNYNYGYQNRVLRNLGDTTWSDVMVPGKQYMVVLSSSVGLYYNTYVVTKNELIVNNKLDSTYYDTVVRRTSEVAQYTSKLIFQWGIDKSLLDKLTPPQFTYPVNRSTASWDNQSLMEFGGSIPEIPLYADFSFDWKEADGYDVSDTMLYDLYVYDCKPGDSLSKIVKGKPKWVYKAIKDLTLTDSIADSVKAGNKYVARIRVRTAPDSNKYNRLADGWSLPIAFKIVDTTSFMDVFDVTNACFPGDTANLSREVITPSVDDLVKNRVRLKMGKFDLIVQSGKLKDKKYSGEGFVIWRPMGFGCNIKVQFDSIVINKDHQIISGTAKSIHTDKNNYLRLNINGNKWTSGIDMATDKANEYMDQIAKTIGEKGDDVKLWYERINMGSNALTEMIRSGIEHDFSLGTVTTPVRIDNKMLKIENNNFAVAVNDFFFTPVTAQVNLLAVFGSPRDNVYIPVLATNICIMPNSFISDSTPEVNLFSPRDYEFELADGYTMRFKKPSNFAQVKDGCHLKLSKNGLEFTIDVDLTFGKSGQDGNKLLAVDLKNSGVVDPSKPVQAHFTTTFSDWDDWVAKIAMDPFTIVGSEDYTFLPTGRGIIFDHSTKRTPKEVRFPANYTKKGEQNKWKGLYLDYFGIMLPEDVSNTFVDLNGEDDDTPDSTLIYRVGTNGERTDTVEYVYPGHRISFTASQLVWDKEGLSVLVSVNDIFKGETRNGGGWYFSLDTVGINIEKSKFKYGKICGKAKVPLFEGRMVYSCLLATDSLVFSIVPGDSLNLNLFLAKIKLDSKSSYFRINHDKGGHTMVRERDKVTGSKYTMLSQNSTTRIDLTLNGKIDINFEKMGVDASLASIKFEKMYLRNFRESDVQRGKGKVKAYEFGELDFCIGTWSKASPQKYVGTSPRKQKTGMTDNLVSSDLIGKDNNGKEGEAGGDDGLISGSVGGFEYNLTTFETTFSKVSGKNGVYKAGIEFAGKMKLGISESMKFGANAGFGISCEVDVKHFEVSKWEGHFDSVRFTTDIGPLKVDAAVMHSSDDTIYGNSWRGMAKVTVAEVITCAMGCGFGTLPKPDGNGEYDWWFFEGAAQLQKGGVPLGPVSINGFGGGFAYNCIPNKKFAGAKARDLMSSNFVNGMVAENGGNYRPQYDAWMAKAGISLCLTGDPTTLNADGTLNLRIANGHFSGICLQVNAHMMSTYDKDSLKSEKSMLDIGAFIDYTRRGEDDWTLTFSAIAKADINMNALLKNAAADFIPASYELPGSSVDKIKGAVPGCLSKYVEPMIDSTMAYNDVAGKTERFNKHDFSGGLSFQIPIDLYINKSPGKDADWFFAVGRPAYEDRVRFKFEFDLVVCRSETEWTFYFMTGNYFPDGFALPAIPDEVAEFLGGKYKERAERGRILPTFKDAGGFAVGLSFKSSIEFDMILYVEGSAYIGFDAALINTKGQGCEGFSQIGKNNYYGMGQAYLMMKGSAGLSLNLGFWKGKLELISAGLGAIVQAGGPNPTWAFGMLRFKCSTLGGKLKINTAVDFELGHTCVPGASDPLANVKLFQSVTPGYTSKDYTKPENVCSPFTRGVIVSNMPWNQEVLLTCVDEKNKTVTRKFMFILDEKMSTYEYINKNGMWEKQPLKISPSSTDENTIYFNNQTGGFRENCRQRFHFYGRVFEYRTSDGNNLSDWYKYRDTAYNVGKNSVYLRFAPNNSNSKTMAWRLPLYTDNNKTTFVTNKRYYQDTIIYIKTEDAPENLYNQVVYTWPYNGDPMMPIEEIFRDAGRYRVLIYPYMHRDFLSPDHLDQSGRKIKAFLIESGWGETATAVACDYTYHEKGYQGSTIPCIEVTLPSDFSPSNYNGQNLAVRLMLVRDKDYQAQLNALNSKADELMTTTRAEQQSRSNLGELYNEFLYTGLSGVVSGNMGTTVTQDTTTARGVSTGEGSTSGNFNVRLAQLKAATDEYLYGEKDTAMNFSRKSLASGYVAAVRAGQSVYNLYFRLCDKYTKYSSILENIDISYLFSVSMTLSRDHDGSSSETFKISSHTPNSEKQMETARFAYLFDEYVPTNPQLYRTGVRLPAIFNAIVDYTPENDKNGSQNMKNLLDLYKFYAQSITNVNSAVFNTIVKPDRPKADCKDGSTHILCTNVKSSNWCDFTDEIDRFYLAEAAKNALCPTENKLLSCDNGVRVRHTSNFINYSNFAESGTLIPVTSYDKFGPDRAPRLIRWKNLDTKGRIDSVHMMGKSIKYQMTDNYTTTSPELTYTASFEITDAVIGTMLDDIKKFNNFFQGLLDFGIYMHSRGLTQKIDELYTLYTQSRYLNTLSFTESPYTFPKSVFGTWWMNSFYANYKANEATGEIRFKKYKKQPFVSRDDMLTLFGHQSSRYWQDFVIHINSMPMQLNKTKGSLWADLFDTKSDYYSAFSSTWFSRNADDGIIPKQTSGKIMSFIPICVLYNDYRNKTRVIGYAAERTLETLNNPDARPLIATYCFKSKDASYGGFFIDMSKQLNDYRSLKFRYYKDHENDKFDNNWWE